MASRKIEDLHPKLQLLVREHICKCKEKGIDLLVYCTFRSQAEQDRLYEKGRSEPGPKVTWIKKSKHSHVDAQGKPCSLAYDCVPLVDGKPQWEDKATYYKVGVLGELVGLKWGGNWKERDMPHFEINE